MSNFNTNTFSVGTATAAPGEISIGSLPIAIGMDAREMTIPIAVAHGKKSGPTLLIDGGLHGIEIVTLEICRQLVKERVDASQLSGTVVFAPQLNPWAFLSSIRFTPQDAQDMNRVFPGTQGSTLSFQVARVITRELLDRADYIVDCHSCNPPSLHFTIVGEEGTADVREKSIGMAKALGYPVVNANTAYVGTMSGYTLLQGKPTITPEFVFSRRFDNKSIQTGVTGMLNVMKHLGMLPGEIERFEVPGSFDQVRTYISLGVTRGGLVFFAKECGEHVKMGEPVAIVRDYWGTEIEKVIAPRDGIVIAYPLQGNQAASTGDKVAYLAYT